MPVLGGAPIVQLNGIFIAEIGGEAGRRIREINEQYDPRLARYKAPHVTITGSSGAGPIPASTSAGEISRETRADRSDHQSMFSRPLMRFMQSGIVVLPLDPHGPCGFSTTASRPGLPFQPARFTFSPHCT